MTHVKTVIFDFIGTLTSVKNYSMEDSKKKLCDAIAEVGFKVDSELLLRRVRSVSRKIQSDTLSRAS